IKVPNGPPDPAPQLTFLLVHKLGILRSGGFTATTRCDQSCKLSVTGTLTPVAPPRKHHRAVVVRLKTVTRNLLPGTAQKLRLPLTSLQVRSLVGGLGKTKRMKLTLQETATVAGTDAEPTVLTQTLFVSR